jgi:pyruvate dehydrogenase E2 component (dihydrolipoamide acetyltransferase)
MKKYFNIGVAVDTPNGLMVPVIKNADTKSLTELQTELVALAKKARDGKLGATDLQGACFSISSLGGIGGTNFTPIVNAPEVAILGVAKSQVKPVWNGSEFIPATMLPLALSYDHRVIDGALGARFITDLSKTLEDIREILI